MCAVTASVPSPNLLGVPQGICVLQFLTPQLWGRAAYPIISHTQSWSRLLLSVGSPSHAHEVLHRAAQALRATAACPPHLQ